MLHVRWKYRGTSHLEGQFDLLLMPVFCMRAMLLIWFEAKSALDYLMASPMHLRYNVATQSATPAAALPDPIGNVIEAGGAALR
eukprot:scaffold236408_cov22-Prasinocladus_malaysianus.AAC.1